MSSKLEPLDHHTLQIDTNQLRLSLVDQGLISQLKNWDASTQVGLSVSLVSWCLCHQDIRTLHIDSLSELFGDQPRPTHHTPSFPRKLETATGIRELHGITQGSNMSKPASTCKWQWENIPQQRRLESCGCHQVPNLYCLHFLSTLADYSEPKGRILKWNSTTVLDQNWMDVN